MVTQKAYACELTTGQEQSPASLLDLDRSDAEQAGLSVGEIDRRWLIQSLVIHRRLVGKILSGKFVDGLICTHEQYGEASKGQVSPN